jgi:hypothetical protein
MESKQLMEYRTVERKKKKKKKKHGKGFILVFPFLKSLFLIFKKNFI